VANRPKRSAQRQRPSAPAQPAAASTVAAPTPPAPSPPASDKAQLTALIEAIEQARGSRALVYWTTDLARVSESATMSLYDQLERIGRVPQLDLVLFTRGGDTEAPWRIVSLIREYCDRFAVLVPHRASSAGTLIALGADEIVMTPLSALGPIDPSRQHPLLPTQEPVSVQDMRHAMHFVREPTGPGVEMPYTPEAMAQIFSALFDKIHPLAIGAIEQSYALAKLVARMCLETHMDPAAEQAQIKAIVDRLCDDYKSHGYQINRSEARAAGLKAIDAPAPVATALVNLLKFYLARTVFPTAKPSSGKVAGVRIAWLDSTVANYRVDAQYSVLPDGKLEALGDGWVEY
jgi:hypothetical protein